MKRAPWFALPLALVAGLLNSPAPVRPVPALHTAADAAPWWAPQIPSLPVPKPREATPAPSYSPPAYSAPAPRKAAPDSTFANDVNIAIRVVERYWSRKIVGFKPVKRIVPYRITGEVMCGSQPIPTENAAYCSLGDFIAYDVNWTESVYKQLGDAFVFYLLGHEYGHAVQNRLGIDYQFTIHQELQADCFAGAYIGDSVRIGDFSIESGDLQELKDGLLSVSDPDDQPWFEEGSHGNAAQRTGAFFEGYEQGLDTCDLP